MPNKDSAVKRVRQNEKRRLRNRAIKSTLKTVVRKASEAIAAGDAAVTKTALVSAQATIAKSSKKGAIHARKAARITSRLMKRANKAAAAKK